MVSYGMNEGQQPAETESSGMAPEAAFAILGDETRLNILRVLWQRGAVHAYDDVDDSAATISFSELRRHVDVRDNGRFNYHLSKLVPQFVRKTDDGYRLSGAGKRLARTVATVAGGHDVERIGEVDTDCPVCGGRVIATYEDQWLRVACTECAGVFGDAAPHGTLLNAPFPAPGLVGRTPDEAVATELYRCMLDLASLMQGVCPGCASPVTGRLDVCEAHDATDEAFCGACGTPFEAWGELRCETCRFAKRLPVDLCVMGLAPVIGRLYAEGINVLAPSLETLFEFTRTAVTTTTLDTPRGVRVSIGPEDELTVTLDEHLTVIDVAQ
jgi:hypothetical protein